MNKPIFITVNVKSHTEKSYQLREDIRKKVEEAEKLGLEEVDVVTLHKEVNDACEFKPSKVNIHMISGYYEDAESDSKGACIELIGKTICVDCTVEEIDKLIAEAK